MSYSPATPPIAKRVPHVHEVHGDHRPDDWHWLKDRDDPDVIAYLEAENAYTDAVMAPTAPLQERLYAEILGRIQETDLSFPVPHGPWEYYGRSVEGLQYAIHCRRARGDGAAVEEVLLDENAVADGHDYCAFGVFETSPDHRLLAWSVDTTGDESYDLAVRNLDTGADGPEVIPNTTYDCAWASDNRTLFYTTLDDAQRPWRLWRHTLGTDPAQDILVHQEDDDRFWMSVWRARSGAYLVMHLQSKVTSEVWVLPADDPGGALRVIEPRRQGIEYDIDHQGGVFLIRTNDEAANFALMTAPVDDPGRANWREVIPHRADVTLEDVAAFAGHVVVTERAGGLRQLRVRSQDGSSDRVLAQTEAVGVATVGANPEYDTSTLRFHYTSLVTPRSVFDEDVVTGERVLRKQEPVLGGYDPHRYRSGRAWAKAPDGTSVPISWVARADTPLDGTAPALLYAYGAYEHSTEPAFSSLRVSLLERGFVFAIAHPRGGGEMGRAWYEDGKYHAKRNTFTDVVACATHLVAERFAAAERVVLLGGSAGGLMVGAVLNLAPELFAAAVAEVPFVDVVSTMLDESLPLTVVEWEEWGDPRDIAFYETIKAYSPYDNVGPGPYPPLLVTAGLNDPRVAYWEPAKWVAKLRATKAGDSRLLLKTEMGAGHSGPSGRYDAWRREALIYAFMLTSVGITT